MSDFNNRSYRKSVITEEGEVRSRTISSRTQKYDEHKIVKLDDKTDKIIVNSTFVDVNISATDTSDMEVHFYGEAEVDEQVNLDMQLWKREIIITVRFTSNCYNGKCQLNINIPHKKYKLLNVQTLSANVNVDSNVTVENIEIRTQAGNVKTNANFTNAFFRTKNGKVNMAVKAENDVDIAISTISGDIDVHLDHIKELKIKESNMVEICKNTHRDDPEGYTAHMRFSTIAGDIVIK